MSGIWNRNIGLSIFGESHGPVIGITINGLQAGFILDETFIQSELNRRRPGYHDYATPRKEKDHYEIISGIFEQRTTGAPLTMIIRNNNTKSEDYESIKNRVRPGHADYTSKIKYDNFADYRGGGQFSGRLTASLVFAGAIAKSILKEKNILIGAQITKIGHIRDERLEGVSEKDLLKLLSKSFPTIDEEISEEMKSTILEAKDDGDSVGGEIRCFALNVPAGLGDPYFDSFESVLSQLIFSIPAIKGLSFGSGFRLSDMQGSTSNDAYEYINGQVKTKTNHNGGILGGITNGMPIDFTVVVKPTPSISKPQKTVDLNKESNEILEIHGRHDPCIVPRVVPVIEAVLALTILDRLS